MPLRAAGKLPIRTITRMTYLIVATSAKDITHDSACVIDLEQVSHRQLRHMNDLTKQKMETPVRSGLQIIYVSTYGHNKSAENNLQYPLRELDDKNAVSATAWQLVFR